MYAVEMANSFLRALDVMQQRGGRYRGLAIAATTQFLPGDQLLAAFMLFPRVLLKGGNVATEQGSLGSLQGASKLQPKTALPLERFNRECPLAHDSRQIVELVRRQVRRRI